MYNYSTLDSTAVSSAAAGGVLGALLAFLGAMLIFIIIVGLVIVIAHWKIFTKAGKPGWAALIPIYNSIVMCQVAGVSPWWILIVFGCSLLSFIPILGSLISLAASIYFLIILNVSLARAFGKEDSFAVGLILLPIVFEPILGFGKDEYKGPNPMEDIIFKDANKKNNANANNKSTVETLDAKFCSSCGTKLENDTKFCNNCGAKVD